MQIEPLSLSGCKKIIPKIVKDARGDLVKTFVQDEYRDLGLRTDFSEEYYSHSKAGVLRGLHFQMPPHEYYKIITCLDGRVRDVILDLRAGSPTFRQCQVLELNAIEGWFLYLPPGIAHGYLVLSQSALVSYHVTSLHTPEFDAGVLWNSVPVNWGTNSPLISARDAAFPRLADFATPFVFSTETN